MNLPAKRAWVKRARESILGRGSSLCIRSAGNRHQAPKYLRNVKCVQSKKLAFCIGAKRGKGGLPQILMAYLFQEKISLLWVPKRPHRLGHRQEDEEGLSTSMSRDQDLNFMPHPTPRAISLWYSESLRLEKSIHHHYHHDYNDLLLLEDI